MHCNKIGTNQKQTMEGVGIDDIAVYFPKLHFRIEDFANFRNLDFAKLNKGLGLESMSIPDVH